MPALVVGIEEETENLLLSTIRRNYRDFLPVVQFRTWQGQPVWTRVEVGVERNPPQIGQHVEICYDAAWPHRVRLTGPGLHPPRIVRRGVSGVFRLAHAIIMLLAGLFGTLVTLFLAG